MPIYTLDFENLAAGDIVNNQYQGQGVTISSAANHPAMVFDTDNPTGGDYDLATNNLGNVLIVSEDGDSSDPDDNGGGGSICFTFDEPTDVKNLTVLDNEEGGLCQILGRGWQLPWQGLPAHDRQQWPGVGRAEL